MSSQLIGSANLFKIWGSATLTFRNNDNSAVTGITTTQKWLDGTVAVNYTVDEQEDQNGDVCGVVMRSESYDLTLNYVPSSSTTISNAAKDAYVPNIGGFLTISGGPVIKAGSSTDVVNQSWLITGATLSAPNADRGTVSLTARAWPGLNTPATLLKVS